MSPALVCMIRVENHELVIPFFHQNYMQFFLKLNFLFHFVPRMNKYTRQKLYDKGDMDFFPVATLLRKIPS